MNKGVSWIIALGLLSSPAGRAQASADQKQADDYIRKSESEWAESVATGDVTAIERILADDFIGIDSNGSGTARKR